MSGVWWAPVLLGLPFAVLALLVVPATGALSRHPLRLVGFGGAVVFSLDSGLLVLLLWLGLGLLPPDVPVGPLALLQVGLAAWLPWLLGYVLAEATRHARRPAVRAYNIGISALAGLLLVVSALLVRSLAPDLGAGAGTGFGPVDLAAMVVASAAYVLTDVLLTALWVARAERRPLSQTLADPAALVAAGSVLAVNAVGALAALLLLGLPWALLLLVPVVWALVHAGRTGTVALAEHARAQALYRAAAGCQQASSAVEVVAAVVAAAMTATAAPVAVCDEPPGPEQTGAPFLDGDRQRWLVVGPRGTGLRLAEGERTVVATLAALCEQSLARVEALDRVRLVAGRDALTGLLNRRALLAAVARGLSPSSAVLFCDVDRFKAVNDTYGHRCGDEVLVAVARTLSDVVGREGVVGRIGGDEFVVMLPASTPERTTAVRSTLLEAMQAPVEAGGRLLTVRLSVGVAGLADHPGPLPGEVGEDPLDGRPLDLGGTGRDELVEALLERADAAMYRDKHSRRPAREEVVEP